MKTWILLIPAAALVLAGCEAHRPSAAASPAAAAGQPQGQTLVETVEPQKSAAEHPADAAAVAGAQTPAADSASAKSQTTIAAETPAAIQPPASKGKPPPADRSPRRPGDAEKITFEDLNLGMQADIVFRPFMLTDRVQELEGKRISIIGYMHGGQNSQRGIKEFILLKNTECKFGPGGQADHLANVVLKEGETTGFTPGALKVEGTLAISPFQGFDNNTWYIYKLETAQIK